MAVRPSVIIILSILAIFSAVPISSADGVTYDGRSLLINGKRELVLSGSIHYPRSFPELWPQVIAKAKEGGLNTIETYVFWNIHEPQPGQYNFQGRYDVVSFLKLVQQNGLYAILRVGPFIEAEWNFGGLPYWLKEVPGMIFRTNNEPFKFHMQQFTQYIVNLMKENNLYASQGGPIILSQIENEYNNVAKAFKDEGAEYVQWAGNMAVSMNIGVPWVMCKEKHAPGEVISACNGRNCGDTFDKPDSPNKPMLWTENWTQQYRVFGDPPAQRSAEDIAYSVARFFSKNGTLNNYYMYYGGTNFGRTSSAFVTTRYYDEAPLDEYGLYKEPKFGHLRDLHFALKLNKKALLSGASSVQNLGKTLEARIYGQPGTDTCVAFVSNSHKKHDFTATFRGVDYFLPRRSITILADCKTLIFNTKMVNSQHNARTFVNSNEANINNKWEMSHEPIPTIKEAPLVAGIPLEHMNVTKDISDYLWYTTKFNLEQEDLPFKQDIRPVLQISSLGDVMHAFANGVYIGSGHGTNVDNTFVFSSPMNLQPGENNIALLSMTVGMPDSGAYLEHRIAGIHTVAVQGLNVGTLALTGNEWGHQVGLQGESMEIYTEDGSQRVSWSEAQKGMPLTWYKKAFDAPHGDDPVALDMSSMGKGFIWINGENIGRYWVSYLNPLGEPTQSVYHIPRSLLKPTNNFMVVFEESGGDPEAIKMVVVKRDNICTYISETNPGNIRSWSRVNSQLRSTTDDVKPQAKLQCDNGKFIQSVVFASFGNPTGMCGEFTVGNCHTPQAKNVVEKACLGKPSCVIPVAHEAFGVDASCPGTTGTLAVQVKCSKRNPAA